jgi:hypothetical protein
MNKLSFIRRLIPVIVIMLLLVALAPVAIRAGQDWTISVTSSPNPSFVGQPVVFTATLTPPPPPPDSLPLQGTTTAPTVSFPNLVYFFVGSDPTPIGGVSPSNYIAQITVDNLTAGDHTIIATWGSITSPQYTQHVIVAMGVGGEVEAVSKINMLILGISLPLALVVALYLGVRMVRKRRIN